MSRDTRARVQRATVPVLVLVALAVHWPALTAKRFADDFNQLAMIEGRYPVAHTPFDLYDFITEAGRRPLMERGVLPWWSHPHLELRFLRPLSSVLLWLDVRLFGEDGAVLAHLHSLFWWGLSSWAVYRLLRDGFAKRVAVLGAFVFAVAPCHDFPLTWLANREELVSTALGALGLLEYLRWRRGRRARDGVASLALFAGAMLAGEYSLCFGGYVAAIEFTRSGDSLARRASGLACFALPAAVYLALRHAGHYGAFGTGYYHDPLRDFGAYAGSFPGRVALLFATAWGALDERAWLADPLWKVLTAAGVCAAALGLLVRRVWPELERDDRRALGWMLGGSTLALAPLVAVGVSVRLLVIPMIGVAGTVAVLLDRVWFPRGERPRRRAVEWTELLALALAFVHLFRGPLDSWLMHEYLHSLAEVREHEMAWLREKAEGKSTVVIVRASFFATIFVAPMGLDASTVVRGLAYDSGRMLLVRKSARELELVAGGRPLFPVGSDDLIRDDDVPLRAGEQVDLPGMRATIEELRDDGKPRRLTFAFDRDLDNPSFLWIVEGETGFEELELPAPGHGEPVRI